MNPCHVTFDSTDHFAFVCSDCGCDLHILSLTERTVGNPGPENNCHTFWLKCPICRQKSHRKIYWLRPEEIATSTKCQMQTGEAYLSVGPDDMP